jgi:transposase
VLRYGIPWKALPQLEGEPSGKTCWRRLDEWERAGVWPKLIERLHGRSGDDRLAAGDCGRDLRQREKGGAATGPSPADRGRTASKLHLCCDGDGRPLTVALGGANDNERGYLLVLVDAIPLLRKREDRLDNRPDALLADRGYDAEHLRESLAQRGIEPRIVRRRKPGQGRSRDPQVPMIERTNAWLHNWRRVGIRYKRRGELYLALVQLACAMILSRFLEGAF